VTALAFCFFEKPGDARDVVIQRRQQYPGLGHVGVVGHSGHVATVPLWARLVRDSGVDG
jgi:hypothetical protein